jgi:transcriptional regulator with XRE-family HTH domain
MKLDAYLEKHQESEEDFATRAGIGRATVFRIKKSGFAQSVAVIRKIVAACGGEITWDELMAAAPRRRKRRAA